MWGQGGLGSPFTPLLFFLFFFFFFFVLPPFFPGLPTGSAGSSHFDRVQCASPNFPRSGSKAEWGSAALCRQTALAVKSPPL